MHFLSISVRIVRLPFDAEQFELEKIFNNFP